MSEPTKEQMRAWRAIGATPYGAGLTPGVDPEDLTLDTMTRFVEALSERLTDVAQRHTEDKAELDQLKMDVAAVRRVFQVK